ncbi:hypothetical protein FG386_003711 [Cryptosporidium ryanae]|uniref:uncharacterized protein n=1 Tax=Cryptosporidium ryanae TaxID=515981 RepID=UPI00351A73BA|nr:hypothetical protein FG386_003711 [Cryptosporidium ryanae]
MNILRRLIKGVILIFVYYVLYLSSENERSRTGPEVSFSQIQEEYVRINVSRGIEQAKILKEMLQVAIFNYLLSQKRFSGMKLLGLEDSKEFDDAIFDLEEAAEILKTAKNKWDNIKSATAGFTYRNENKVSRDIKFRLGNSHLDGSLCSSGFRGYKGDRGIDFQGKILEDFGQVCSQPSPKKKLDREVIEKLDLGFDYNDLPQKYIKMLEDRKVSKRMNKLKFKGGSFLDGRITEFQQMHFSDSKLPADLSGDGRLQRRIVMKSGGIGKDKKLEDQKREFIPSKGNSLVDSLESVLESLGKSDISDIMKGIKKPNIGKNESTEHKIKALKQTINNKLGIKGQTKIQNAKQKQNLKDFKQQKRSKGVLKEEPMFPSDVAIEVESHIGGPLKHILVKESTLKANKELSEHYERYLTVLLRCLKLYEEEVSFEELFMCSRKQSSLMFALIQILDDLNVDYTFEVNDINNISAKLKSINGDKEHDEDKNELELEEEDIEEGEQILDFLISKNIFSGKPTNKACKTTLIKRIRKKDRNNLTNSVNNSTEVSGVSKMNLGSEKPCENETEQEQPQDDGSKKEASEHLKFVMNRLGFTLEEYNLCDRVSRFVDELIAREIHFLHFYEKGDRPEPHLIYEYKIVLEKILLEITLCRIKNQI